MNNIHSNSLLSLLTSKFSAKFRLLVMVLFVFLTPMFSFGQSPQAFDSNGTFIVPAGVTSITVQAWGAGGSGGGSSNAGFLSARGGGGGGGGAYATATFAVIPGGSLPVVVGTGGTGVSGDSGTSGSFSTITGYTGIIYAAGGSGGVANKSGGEPAGGSGGTVATSKGTPIAGGNGGDGDSGAFIRSGAGGAGANSGGAGGSSVTSGTFDGKLGLQPGGGGSGSRTSGSGGYQTGGNGGNGKVIISWVCPTYAFTAAASATAICGSGSSTVKLTSTSLPAGTYTVTYNTTNPGSSGNTATMVFSGTTGTFSTNILSATSTINVTNLSSGTAPSICSSVISSNNTASIVVNPVSVGGAVASAQTICSGTSPAALTLSGQTGTVVKWQRATDVGFTAGLADIVSTATTLPSATIGNLTTNTYFRAVLQSGICSVANSSPVLITVMPIVKITLGVNPIIAQGTTSANLPYTLNNGAQANVTFDAAAIAAGITGVQSTAISGTTGQIVLQIPSCIKAGTYSGNMNVNTYSPINCPSVNYPFSVTITSSPAPTGTASQSFCSGATVANLVPSIAGASSIKWYDAATGGNLLTSGTILTSGTHYYASQTPAGCESTARLDVTVTISNPAPPSGAVAQSFCSGATVASLSATGTNIKWYAAPSGGSALASTTVLTNGIHYYATQNPSGCESNARLDVTATVTAVNTLTLTSAAATISQTVCISSPITNITHTTTGATGIGVAIGLPAGVSATWVSNTITISGTPTQTGTFTYSIPLTGGCGSLNAVGTITVNATSVGGAVLGGTTVCSGTNSTVLTLSGHTGTVVRWESSLDNFATSGNVIANTSTTLTAINLIATTSYRAVLQSGVCSITNSASATIKIETNTWDGSSWSTGFPPTSSQTIVFNGNYTVNAITGDINACSLIINSPAVLTIADLSFVTIQNDLTVNAGATLNVANQGSLIMISDTGIVTNVGTTKINKTTSPFKLYDYTYWSSPIVSTVIATTFSTWTTDRAYAFHPENFNDANDDGFDDNGDDYLFASSMDPGRGYIIMGPTSGVFPRTESVAFTGKVNNGVVNTPINLTPGAIVGDNFNLVGNPYPSAIKADELIKANISATGTINKTIDGTLYFWTHNMSIGAGANLGPDAANFSSDDYALYNLSGGTGTSGSLVNGVVQSNKPLGFIASGQGFFVQADAAGLMTFNNAMRVGASNTQFYKTAQNKGKANKKDRLWLNLQNADGMFSQQLIGYFENTTNGYDNGYDGLVSDAGNYVNFYSFIDTDIYKIQGRESFNENDQLPLGYSSAVTGTFTINIDSKEGVFNSGSTGVFLEDKLLSSIHNLKVSPYTFNTAAGTFDDRFVLRYTDRTLGNVDFEKTNNQVSISKDKNELKIKSEIEIIKQVTVFDLLGKKVFEKTTINSNEFRSSTIGFSQQIGIVKVTLANGEVISKKVVF